MVALAAVAAVALTQIGGRADVRPLPAPHRAFSKPDDVPIAYYLVPTDEQAQAVLRAEEEAARIRFAAGEFEQTYGFEVVVVEDEASLEKVMRSYIDANWIRHEWGLSEMTLVDLTGHGW